ncbi:hypothetical protein [Paenibacillus sp. GXUN7292]|uniref:hypothetical protein n=1 Tax=Paenibacillus sp. GXUN7292 TaxID=3422499 RepID=UPI003D7C7F9A
MSEPWAASMSGVPWTASKMNSAVKQLRNRATISFVVGSDLTDDLLLLDKQVFSKRPDLILSVYNPEEKGRYTEKFLEILAGLKHVAALDLSLKQQQDLSMLSGLRQMKFLIIRSKKSQNLDFIRNYKQLEYLWLSGKFVDLAPIADCMMLNTLILNCAIDQLDFVSELPLIKYLSIDSCTLNGSLDVLAHSNIRMLKLSAVHNLTNIDALGTLHNLAYLHLTLPKVERLCDFSNMKQLRQLELHFMKSLREIENLWTADRLEVLELREINNGIKAEALSRITEMDSLRQVDFRFIDFNKGRIAALSKCMHEAGKEQLLYENIPEEKRIPSMAIEHLSKILM